MDKAEREREKERETESEMWISNEPLILSSKIFTCECGLVDVSALFALNGWHAKLLTYCVHNLELGLDYLQKNHDLGCDHSRPTWRFTALLVLLAVAMRYKQWFPILLDIWFANSSIHGSGIIRQSLWIIIICKSWEIGILFRIHLI